MNRCTELIAIRPKLKLDVETIGQLELFQNSVLRPILKFQNDLILEYLDTHPQFIPQVAKVNKQEPKSYEEVLVKFIKANNSFRNKLYGMVVGLMTVEEYKVYLENTAEYNRRIVGMCVQRVMSHQ